MNLIAVDPGKHACACAWFSDAGKLQRVEMRADPLRHLLDTRVVCEKPQVYSGSRVRAADLVDLSIAAGRMTGAFPEVEYILPRVWKGQIPKAIHHARVRAKLTVAELRVIETCGVREVLLHNIWDAVALGLKTLGRL